MIPLDRKAGHESMIDPRDMAGYGKEKSSDEPALIDKTITENGAYDASDDGVSGYSSVTVDVSGGPSFPFAAMTDFSYINGGTPRGEVTVFAPVNADGDFSVTLSSAAYEAYIPDSYYANEALLFAPARKIVITKATNPTYSIIFSPSESFDGFYNKENKLTLTGDAITPGDGKIYKFDANQMTSTYTISKYDVPVIPTT